MKEFNAVINEIFEDSFIGVNPLRYGKNVDGFYLGFNSEKKTMEFKNGTKKVLNVPSGIYGRTVLNVYGKLIKRYQGDGTIRKEDLREDCMSEAVVCVINALFKIYIGQVKIAESYILIKRINSNSLSEIKQILENESKEEKEERVEKFRELIQTELCKKVVYNTAINLDFDNNFKNNKMQCETVVRYSKDENGKTTLEYDNINYNSINTPSRIDINSSGDVNVDTIDYFYGQGNPELTEKCADNVQQTDNSTKGMYGYLLERYYDKLTAKQREWFEHAVSVSSNGSDFSFIKKGDENYGDRNCRSFKNYIQDRIFHLIQEDEESKLCISKNRKIIWKSISEIEDKIKAILMQQCKETQIDMLISILNKDNKTSEMIVNHLLDNSLYSAVRDVITGKISKYKFKVVYLEKVLRCLERLI